ncbi:MAG TPA: hypothetical protein VD978_06445 [Azospirillum sp.]|nr:hypothetical protein [Azospirillum sp.]
MTRKVSTTLGAIGTAIAAAIIVGLVLLFTSGLLLALAIVVPVGILVLVAGALLFGKAEVHVIRRDE